MWARCRSYGLTFVRIALGVLFIYPKNPLFSGVPWFDSEAAAYPWDLPQTTEFWVRTVTESRDLFYTISSVQLLAGALIVLGLFFRPACSIMAATFIAIWALVYQYGTSFEIQLEYLAFAVLFLGLMVAGPGRWALRLRRD